MPTIIDGTSGVDTIQNGIVTSAKIASGQTPSFNGIQFPATQAASADANTLDDYEEGTWSPNVSGNTTYTIQRGSYTKIGRQVTAIFDIQINAIGTGSQSTISGLPFASASAATNPQGIVAPVSYWGSLAININWLSWRLDENSTSMLNAYTTSAAGTAVANGNIMQNGTRVIGTITYFV